MSSEDYAALREARRERHANWHETNLRILMESNVKFRATNNGETLLFREPDKPKVDFYPSTGRRRVARVKDTFSGGAHAFLAWYRKQQVEVDK